MKPWQTKTKSSEGAVEEAARANTLDERLQAMNAILRASRAYFAEAGRRGARACQFVLGGGDDWYVSVDENGGRAARGRLDAATCTWSSDVEALDAAFRGNLLPGRVRIEGDPGVLRDLFRAIAQAPIR